MTNYVAELQPELAVNYCHLVAISVDTRETTNKLRTTLGATWPFLTDTDRTLLYTLEMTDKTDKAHGDIYIPYSFTLDYDLTIFTIYNGWWFLGRPTVEEIRMDLRALMMRRKDWIYGDPVKT